MAKIPFTKLGLKKKEEVETFSYNEQEIVVKQYLPINEKLELMARVITKASENSETYYNPAQIEVFFNLEMVYAYTNITFTEKQKNDFAKIYDLLEENGVLDAIFELIPEGEKSQLLDWTTDIAKNLYAYNSSALGVLSSLRSDYNNLDMDLDSLQEKLKDTDGLELFKQVVDLG